MSRISNIIVADPAQRFALRTVAHTLVAAPIGTTQRRGRREFNPTGPPTTGLGPRRDSAPDVPLSSRAQHCACLTLRATR